MGNILRIILFLLAIPQLSLAQDVKFTVSARDKVTLGDRFQVMYSVNENGTEFQGPDFKDFRILSGPNLSTNRSYQIINGKMSQSISTTYTYYLQAIIEGQFTIPSATVYVDKVLYKSNELDIEVTKGNTQASQGTGRQTPAQNRQATEPATGQDDEDDVFIRAFISKSNPFQGEQVIVTYKIFTTINISQINFNNMPSFTGFWSKDLLSGTQQLEPYNEVYNGREYMVADLKKIALIPQKSGELTLDPMEITCLAKVRREGTRRVRDPFFDSFFDDPFFNNMYQNVELNLASNPLKINVRPLPLENRPLDFNGAVGSFRLSSSIDKTELKANEAINLKITVSGKGNIELINQFDLSFPPDIEAYDPKVINDINTSASGVSGSRSFEYLLIPRNAGTFTIKPYSFKYFDLATKTYKTLTTPEYTLKVEKGEESSSGIAYSGVSQADIQYIGSDIRHIKSLPFQLNRINTYFFGSTSFYLWLIIPLVLFLLIIILWKRNTRRQSNAALIRNRKATRVARKNLKSANRCMKEGNHRAFFNEVSRALWGYLSDKFNIPLSELSMDTVHDRLKDKSIREESINEFIQTLDHCEYARFAPDDESSAMDKIYTEAVQIISKIERELKL